MADPRLQPPWEGDRKFPDAKPSGTTQPLPLTRREERKQERVTEEIRRQAASIVHSAICDIIAHDPPNGDPLDTELRRLAQEFRERCGYVPPAPR